MVLTDNYDRPLHNMRIAVTNFCNLECKYCHKEGEATTKIRRGIMTPLEIARIAKIAVNLGISKVKFTGGEPLLRKDIGEIVKKTAALPGLKDLSMTTNGSILAPLAEELYTRGLNRINVSLPTLDKKIYRKLTGGKLEDVLEGVKAAVKAGLFPVKLNMVILKGINENFVPEAIKFAKETATILQLIELMPINVGETFFSKHHKALDEYETMLKEKAVKVETRKSMQNRHIYHLTDVKVEIIHPMDNTEFCRYCTRLRVTSDGKLKPCLIRKNNLVDILSPLRKGATDQELTELFEVVNRKREPYCK